MSIGYACLTIGTSSIRYKTCRLRNATSENLKEIIRHNLKALDKAIEYNIENNIRLFRISSDIIPFASKTAISINWQQIYSKELQQIGDKINHNNIRVSMHPGQYTVINSPNPDVVDKAVLDLEYHAAFLNSLKVDSKAKIILHIGGVYGDKSESIKRFIYNYDKLSHEVKKRLVIENDDKSYNINDVLNISREINVPVVYDNLHNQTNPYDIEKDDIYWIKRCQKTWKEEDGKQKIHYSQQDSVKKRGSHSATIEVNEFIEFYKKINDLNLDIMFEVKDKNISVVKCAREVEKLKLL